MGQRNKREHQVTKIRNESGDITTDAIEIHRLVRDYCVELYAKKLHYQEE